MVAGSVRMRLLVLLLVMVLVMVRGAMDVEVIDAPAV